MAGTILIVEDEPELAALLGDVLGAEGYTVVFSTAGTAASRTAEIRPQAIVIDYGMPGLTGAQVVEQMRQNTNADMPPVILVTGRHEAAQLAGDLGADAYLRKPFDVDELVRVIARLISS